MRVQGSGFNEIEKVLFDESHKNWTQGLQMRDQSHLNLLGTIFERKLIALNPKGKELKRGVHDLKNQDANQGPRHGSTQGFNWLQIGSKLVPRNLDPGPHLTKVGLRPPFQSQTNPKEHYNITQYGFSYGNKHYYGLLWH